MEGRREKGVDDLSSSSESSPESTGSSTVSLSYLSPTQGLVNKRYPQGGG